MDVSVIIVNYKTSQLLVQAIDSILDKTEDIVYEIIVVDNHSQDDSERVVHERYGNRVTYLPLAENVGFGRANNEGLRIVRGRNILFLNPAVGGKFKRAAQTEGNRRFFASPFGAVAENAPIAKADDYAS